MFCRPRLHFCEIIGLKPIHRFVSGKLFDIAQRHFAWQSMACMQEQNWAAENLQVIRTLMERAALYRRALAPIMTYVGLIGLAAALAGIVLQIGSASAFIGYWLCVAPVALAVVLLLSRRQALKSHEPFWSPPARRVARAMLPSLTAGLLIGLWFLVLSMKKPVPTPAIGMADDRVELVALAALWAIFYGCALHAAGFFASRGLRMFGWFFVAAGIGILFWLSLTHRADKLTVLWHHCHWLMGILFGLSQLAYGIYLFLTGEEPNES